MQRSINVAIVAGIAAIGCSLAFGAAAETADEDCSGWFPDWKCEREARPPGSTRPMSMPYLFEDPFITTEAQAVGIWHDTPNKSVFQGGEAGVIALQLRLAITEDLAFIATRDGLTFLRPDNAILPDDEDMMDVTVGFKYALIRSGNWIVTPSLRYEIPLGAKRLFQGQGDGVLIPAASAAWSTGDFHVIGSLGAQVPFDGDQDSTSIFYNLHLDYALGEHFSPFIEVGGMHWTNAGNGSQTVHSTVGRVPLSAAQALLGTGGFEGYDVANLGSGGVEGNDIVTMAWGARFPIDSKLSLGLAYERAISDRKDIFKQRVTAMVTKSF